MTVSRSDLKFFKHLDREAVAWRDKPPESKPREALTMDMYETHVEGQHDYAWHESETPFDAAIAHAARHCLAENNYTDSFVVCVLEGDEWTRYDIEPKSRPRFAVKRSGKADGS